MRAAAVIGVVLYHGGFGPSGGFVGVDVFFVISGFLITSLLETELAGARRIDLVAFYARRVRRLLPALAVVLATTVGGCFLILPPNDELTMALRSTAASALFAANVFFQMFTGDYFGPNISHLPLLHLWSLGVEEQYYLLWPVALTATRRFPVALRWAVLAACALASLGFAEYAIAKGSQAGFYAMPSRWWELSLGALVAWSPIAARGIARWEGLAGAVLLTLAMAFPTRHFPGIGALPATTGAALLLHASTASSGIWRLLCSRPMTFIGRISYPLYLWHWPLLAMAAAAIPGELSPATRAALIVAAFILAFATWKWIEEPVRRSPLVSPHKLVGAALAASIAVAFVMVQASATVLASLPSSDPASVAAHDMPPNMYRCHARGDQPVALPDEDFCRLGYNGSVRVAIWGDSHALSLQPFAAALAAHDGNSAIGYSRDACAPALDYDNGKNLPQSTRCKAFNAAVMPRAEAMDTVILAARWPEPLERDLAGDLAKTVSMLAPHVRRILIIGATPDLPRKVPDCLRTHTMQDCDLPRADFLKRSTPIRNALIALAAKHPNVIYVETIDFFCNQRVCPGVSNAMPLYWDDNHISSSAATAFARAFLSGGTATETDPQAIRHRVGTP